ncbi:MAG: AcrR family transcriptional regulator [Oleiphilaceae bacterium]|jgi:AcrR family transcriptional regulator
MKTILSREEKKSLTRQSLIDAALSLVGAGNNFASISLREVAKNAGLVPTSFYRHFTDMEELGLNVVDDLGLVLRKMMRAARQDAGYKKGKLHSSIEVYVDFVCQHRSHFYFMSQCRTGGTPALRQAIRNELKYFDNELSSDIRSVPMLSEMSGADRDMMSQLIVSTVFDTTIDVLDLNDSSTNYQHEFVELMKKKLRLVWLGASMWRSQQ